MFAKGPVSDMVYIGEEGMKGVQVVCARGV